MVGVFLAGYRHFRLFLIEAGNSLTDYLHRTREACILLDRLSKYCPYRHALFFLRRDALAGMGEVRFLLLHLARHNCPWHYYNAYCVGEIPRIKSDLARRGPASPPT